VPLVTPDVEPLWISHYDYKRGSSLPLHAHRDYFQLISITSAVEGNALVGAASYPLRAGQLFFFQPGLEHGLEVGNRPVQTLDTKFRVLNRTLNRACRTLNPVKLEPDRRITTLLEALYAEAQAAASGSAELCQTLLLQVLILLIRGETAQPVATLPLADFAGADGPETCDRLHLFLRDRCGERISQRSLSLSFRCSYHHLHSLYRARYGLSPLRALKLMRIEKAKQLIRFSDYELKQIALLTGFSTVHHFTRVFAEVAGVTPARWRAEDGNGRASDVVIHPGFINRDLVRQRASG